MASYFICHYDDIIMGTMASQITSLTIVYSIVYSGTDQSKHQSSASLAFVWGIHRGPVNSPHKWPVTRKMFPFDDVIMATLLLNWLITKRPSELSITGPLCMESICWFPAQRASKVGGISMSHHNIIVTLALHQHDISSLHWASVGSIESMPGPIPPTIFPL